MAGGGIKYAQTCRFYRKHIDNHCQVLRWLRCNRRRLGQFRAVCIGSVSLARCIVSLTPASLVHRPTHKVRWRGCCTTSPPTNRGVPTQIRKGRSSVPYNGPNLRKSPRPFKSLCTIESVRRRSTSFSSIHSWLYKSSRTVRLRWCWRQERGGRFQNSRYICCATWNIHHSDVDIELFRLFIDNSQCKHIFFAGCHDNGYLSLLTPYINKMDRITLIKAAQLSPEFRNLGLRIEEFPSVFRTSPLDSPYPKSNNTVPSTATAYTTTFNRPSAPPCLESRDHMNAKIVCTHFGKVSSRTVQLNLYPSFSDQP